MKRTVPKSWAKYTYLRHTPHAMRYALRATRPFFMKEFLSIALCASYFWSMRSAPKKASLFALRPKLNLLRVPNFYEIDPWCNVESKWISMPPANIL